MSVRVSMSVLSSPACSGLMYMGVPMIWPWPVFATALDSSPLTALAIPKSMILGIGPPPSRRDQYVRRFDVAVNDSFLMGVLNRLTNGSE